jgi:hypothetical protein
MCIDFRWRAKRLGLNLKLPFRAAALARRSGFCLDPDSSRNHLASLFLGHFIELHLLLRLQPFLSPEKRQLFWLGLAGASPI